MSDTFTPLSEWQHLQDTDAANEIVQAYNERRQCVDASFTPVDLLGEGSNAQDTAFWRGIQQWILDQVQRTTGDNRWLDHEQEIEGKSALPYYTLAAWRTNSGLYDGFRRATTWPSDWTDYEDAEYNYGVIQAGDIRGPWFFEDLQKGLDALRWTARINPDRINFQERSVVGDPKDTEQEAVDDALSKYDSASWVNGGSGNPYYVASFSLTYNTTTEKYRSTLSRWRTELEFDNTPNHLKANAGFYCLLDTGFFGDLWNNVDFAEPTSKPSWTLFDDMGETQVELVEIGYHPYEVSPLPSSYVVGSYGCEEFGLAQSDSLLLLMQWQFSHTL
jgi:hypothetical protein